MERTYSLKRFLHYAIDKFSLLPNGGIQKVRVVEKVPLNRLLESYTFEELDNMVNSFRDNGVSSDLKGSWYITEESNDIKVVQPEDIQNKRLAGPFEYDVKSKEELTKNCEVDIKTVKNNSSTDNCDDDDQFCGFDSFDFSWYDMGTD